jgi:hypothetical protein
MRKEPAMNPGMVIGLVLVAAGLIDLVVGWAVVLPRAREGVRPVLRGAIATGAMLLIVLGILFLAGLFGPARV